MNNEAKANSLKTEDTPSTTTRSNEEMTTAPEDGPRDANPSIPISSDKPEDAKPKRQQLAADGSPSPSVEPAPQAEEVVPPIAVKPVFVKKQPGFFEEQPLTIVEMAPRTMRNRTRREVLAFGIGAAAMATGAGYLLPQNTLNRLGVRRD